LSVIKPFEVETRAVPKPPKTRGIFLELLYSLKPGRLARVIFVIKGVLSFPVYLSDKRRELFNPLFNYSKEEL
jgi:hypothetical protein